MRRDLLDVDGHHLHLNVIEHPPLLAQPRRTQMGELAGELLIVKRLDRPKPLRTRLPDDSATSSLAAASRRASSSRASRATTSHRPAATAPSMALARASSTVVAECSSLGPDATAVRALTSTRGASSVRESSRFAQDSRHVNMGERKRARATPTHQTGQAKQQGIDEFLSCKRHPPENDIQVRLALCSAPVAPDGHGRPLPPRALLTAHER